MMVRFPVVSTSIGRIRSGQASRIKVPQNGEHLFQIFFVCFYLSKCIMHPSCLPFEHIHHL